MYRGIVLVTTRMHPFLRSKITVVIIGALALWLIVLAVAVGIRRHGAGAELQAMQQRIEDAKRENARLAEQLERMKQPQWLALLARQRLNYKQPDETVVFVYKSEKVGTLSPPQATPAPAQPNWRLWLDWFQGRSKK